MKAYRLGIKLPDIRPTRKHIHKISKKDISDYYEKEGIETLEEEEE